MLQFGKRHDARLLSAAWSGDQNTVTNVLRQHVDSINASASKSICRRHPDFVEGDTAMHLAVRRGHRVIVEMLLSLKAHVDAVNASGMTPLHCAAMQADTDIARVLLDGGATTEAQDTKGWTPLHQAVMKGHCQMVELLLDRGARVAARDFEDNTPLHYAAKAGSERMVDLLASAGAQVNDRNRQDRTPLHSAIIGADHSAAGHVDPQQRLHRETTTQTIKLLLALGADPNAVDARGETPLDLLSYLEGETEKDPLMDLLRASGGQWLRLRHRHLSQATSPLPEVETADRDSSQTPPVTISTRAQPKKGAARAGAAIVLGAEPLAIGRHPVCDVHYQSLTLSRLHARIELYQGSYIIKDLGSHNGTLINGSPIDGPHVLRPGELITVGAYGFEFDGERLIPTHGELSEDALSQEHLRGQHDQAHRRHIEANERIQDDAH